MTPKSTAFFGSLFSLPFIIANFVVAFRIEPFYSFLGAFPAVRNSTFFPMFLLLFFPVGAFIALQPMLKVSKGKRKVYPLNAIVASIMIIIFLILFSALAGDMYRCDVLKIPNCD